MKESSKSKNRKIVLLDMHAILHRAYHAMPDFSTSAGRPTGALYGLTGMVLSLVKTFEPDYIIGCYDLPGGTFRNEIHGGYKAHRKDLEENLTRQLGESREVLEALSIPFYEKKGFEADDLLGTLSEILKKDKNNSVIIASGDMDTLQLVDGKKVQVFTLKRGLNDTIIYDEDGVVERFGFVPKLLPDYKGLRGDPSDNIIGIVGIGEKTAGILISQFGSLKNIYKLLKKGVEPFKKAGLTDRVIELLKEGEEEAEFSRTLAEIRRDVPVDFRMPEKTWRESLEPSRVQKMLETFEFRSLLSRFRNLMNVPEVEVAAVEISARELKKLSVALSLIDSERNNPDLEEILSFAKTRDLEDAKKIIWNELQKKHLEKVYKEIEEPIMPVIERMHEIGIKIDKKYFEKLGSEYHKTLDKIEAEIYKLAGQEFNVKSPKQLSDILFSVLKLPTAGVKKSAGGAYSTQITVLEKLEDTHPIIPKIMEYRELQKLLSTYIDVIPGLVAADGRLHAEFIQNGAATGRFSSNNPNLQNIPVKNELGKAIREGFVAEKGSKLVSFDYSQIELRLAAIFSEDPALIEIFRKGEDVHTAVASKVFGVPLPDVTKEMRRHAKVINFGILYGMGVNALKKNLGSSQADAAEFYENYFKQFKNFKDYLEDTKDFARRNGYTETLFGRRRYFPTINSSMPFVRAIAERAAINAPIQGTAADIMKLAVRNIDEDLEKAGIRDKARLLLQIHDEVIFEIEESLLEKAKKIIEAAMEGVFERSFINFKSSVPLRVNHSEGFTWREL